MKKVVYYVGHYGGFLLCVYHKFKYYKNDEALFIFVKTYGSEPVNSFMENLSKNEIREIGKITCIDECEFWDKTSQEETENVIYSFYEKLFLENGIDIQSLETDIFIHFDEFNSLGIYLSKKNIKGKSAIIVTDPNRLTSFVDMYLFNDVSGRYYYSNLQRKYRTLDNDGIYVDKIYRTYRIEDIKNKNYKKEVIDNAEKYEFFDLNNAKESISDQEKRLLFQLFEIENYIPQNKKYNIFILSSNFTAFKKGTSVETFILYNQVLFDYFIGENCIIKPHPRADYGREVWEKAFEKTIYLPSYIPAEFIDSSILTLNTVLATGSTGSKSIEKNALKTINLGREFWFYYKYIHKIYISLSIGSYIGIKKLCIWGFPISLVNEMIGLSPLFSFDEIINIESGDDFCEDMLAIICTENSLSTEKNTSILNKLHNNINLNDSVIVYLDNVSSDNKYKNETLNIKINKQIVKQTVYNQNEKDEEINLVIFSEEQFKTAWNYKMSYYLKNAGIRINVKSCYEEESTAKQDIIMMNYLRNLTSTYINLERDFKALLVGKPERIVLINDFEKYLNELCSINHLVILSVRDTPGFKITKNLSKKIQQLGISSELFDKHWWGFVAVIYKKKVVFEALEQQMIYFSSYIDSHYIECKSAGLKSGNISQIKIDAMDYSMNKRGINFVVYDLISNQLIDSVCFDTHMQEIPCYRNC